MELPMKRYPRWDRLIIGVFSLLDFSSHAHGLDLHSTKHVNNFYALNGIEIFDKCVSNLHLADVDDDLRLERGEYLNYIFLQSGGNLSYEAYQDLPLSLLSNYLFTACTCSQTQGSGCCVGDKVGVQLDEEGEGFITSNIVNFCISIDKAIKGLLTPTPSPSLAPTRPPAAGPMPVPSTPSVTPTSIASNGPTSTPTKSPTVSPSSTPTGAPTTIAPSSTPTITASSGPTNAPTRFPIVSPSSTPTGAPSTTASDVPSLVPTVSPTSRPTKSPSTSPTGMPSVKPTSAPTKSPIGQPSNKPTAAPSIASTPALSTSAPSQEPTPEHLTCVSFQYGTSNDNGFDASDLFNEVNNTYKTGLILATRSVTIETLNATFPRDGSERFLRQISDWGHRLKPPVHYGQTNEEEQKFEGLGRLGTRGLHVANLQDSDLRSVVLHESKPGKSLRSDGHKRRTVYLTREESDNEIIDISQLSRQLVFYTDEYPVTIDAIIDNPFCSPSNPVTLCAVVASTVCTLLEDGDDEVQIQTVLLAGIQMSIFNGDFENAIPPEHQLPSL